MIVSLQRGKTYLSNNEGLEYDTKQSDDEAPVLEIMGSVENFFTAITRSGSTCRSSIYMSNRTV